MSNAINGFLKHQAAKRRYFQLTGTAGEISRQLYEASDPDKRATLLHRLADAEHEMAEVYGPAFGPDPNPDENGRDMAESTAAGAELVTLLAATMDVAVNRSDPDRGFELEYALEGHLRNVPAAEAELWRALSLIPAPAQRVHLMTAIADLATHRVGGQAAETLYCLAEAEREIAAAAAEGRPPHAPKALSRTTIAALLLAAAAAILLPLIPGFPAQAALGLFGLSGLVFLAAVCVRAALWRSR